MSRRSNDSKYVFLKSSDALADDINNKANNLYHRLTGFDITMLPADEYKSYFINHHLGGRLFFSLQNSAHIIHQSVKSSGKAVNEICFIDYGAGLGTLFMLAGMMGFKKTVYNDYLPGWQQAARSVCNALEIKIDEYVTGDIDSVLQHAAANQIKYDIVASRNVLEHIYSLPHFYGSLFKHNPSVITYSTTTANYHNPVMRWYHVYIHKKADRDYYRQQRISEIKKLQPLLKDTDAAKIADQTRGKGQNDFVEAVRDIASGKKIGQDKTLRSNTCDCITGVWSEHLLTEREYADIIKAAGFKMDYTPGYWDTHYRYALINFLAKALNKVILLAGNNGIILSPFVNITAYN